MYRKRTVIVRWMSRFRRTGLGYTGPTAYSGRRLVTGLATAARTDWKMTENKVITRIEPPAKMNMSALMDVR